MRSPNKTKISSKFASIISLVDFMKKMLGGKDLSEV